VESRAGGVLFSPDGKLTSQFAWSLGLETNNMVEFLTLWKGLEAAIENKISRLIVFGDLMIVI